MSRFTFTGISLCQAGDIITHWNVWCSLPCTGPDEVVTRQSSLHWNVWDYEDVTKCLWCRYWGRDGVPGSSLHCSGQCPGEAETWKFHFTVMSGKRQQWRRSTTGISWVFSNPTTHCGGDCDNNSLYINIYITVESFVLIIIYIFFTGDGN